MPYTYVKTNDGKEEHVNIKPIITKTKEVEKPKPTILTEEESQQEYENENLDNYDDVEEVIEVNFD